MLKKTIRTLTGIAFLLASVANAICPSSLENAIRPFALGRKNWMFSDTEAGADSGAAIYTVLQTAKANGLNVNTYFESLLEALPACKILDDFVKLLPWVWAQPH